MSTRLSRKNSAPPRATSGRTSASCSPGRTAGRSTPDDREEFKQLLEEAGIDDRRRHDGNHHTAGAILNELGVDLPTIMEILRRSRIGQTRRYVKGGSHLAKAAMRRMGDAFVPALEPPTETKTETSDRRAARAQRRRRIR
jgi:hypothetical protein